MAAQDWAEPLVLETTAEDPGLGQTRAALEEGVDLVCAMGGDGTVRAVAEVLSGTTIPMGCSRPAPETCWPATSCCRGLLEAAVAVATGGRNKHIDVGWISLDGGERRAFLVMAGIGFDAHVMEATSEQFKARVASRPTSPKGPSTSSGRASPRPWSSTVESRSPARRARCWPATVAASPAASSSCRTQSSTTVSSTSSRSRPRASTGWPAPRPTSWPASRRATPSSTGGPHGGSRWGSRSPKGRDRRRCHRRDLVRAHRDRAPQPHRAGLDRGAGHAVADRLTSARQRQPAGTRQRKGLETHRSLIPTKGLLGYLRRARGAPSR